jgi:hypothetical protein
MHTGRHALLSILVVAGACAGGASTKNATGEGGHGGAEPTGGGAPSGGSPSLDAAAGAQADALGARLDVAVRSDGSPAAPPATGALNVLTQKYDNARTGWNDREKLLTHAKVTVATFGKLFSRPVDGLVFAQPLYLSALPVGGKTRNVFYVVTMKNTVYAYDADDASDAGKVPLWQAKMGASAPIGGDIQFEVGITSTPVIDPATRTLYCVSKHFENGTVVQRLNALDVVTGMHRTGSPVVITATVPGTGDGTQGGNVAFNPGRHLNRPALLLQSGTVYIAFGSHADQRPYHGWVLGYDAATLKQTGVFNTSANGGQAGIWMAGNGLAGDDQGNVYFVTGNGAATGPDPLVLGEAMVKLDRSLKLVDWHIRSEYKALDAVDNDYGMSGPLLIPGANRVMGGGKDNFVLLYDARNLGKRADDSAVIQKTKGTGANTFKGAHSGGFVYYQGPQGPMVFGWPANSRLLGFKFDGAKLDETPPVVGVENASTNFGSNGVMVISSDGPSNGIIWSPRPVAGDPNHQAVPGKLSVYDAETGKLLWDSRQNQMRDDLGLFAIYSDPIVANGKVYVPTWTGTTASAPAGSVVVYGLLN